MKKAKQTDTFGRRCTALMLILAICYGTLVWKLYVLTTDEKLQETAAAQQTYVIEAGKVRGTVYDCNLEPMTNRTRQWITAAVASPTAVTMLRRILPESTASGVLERLQKGKPVLLNGRLPQVPGILSIQVPVRYDAGGTAVHVIGYTDASGQGVCGIEKDWDAWLAEGGGTVRVRYSADAWGRTLNGAALEESRSGDGTAGVVLTIDRRIQQMAEQVAQESLEKGAVLIVESETGAVRAMVSVPTYDPDNAAQALSAPDSPMLNRALCSYNVGSVFKLVTACSALEAEFVLPEMQCSGSLLYHGRQFQCIYGRGHGKVGLERAVAVSCNGYFIRLADEVGAKSVYEMAQKLGFGREIVLTDSIRTTVGVLPSLQDLSAPAALANFSFGQGELLASPLQVAVMIQTIANGGVQIMPSLIAGTVDENGAFSASEPAVRERVLSEETAEAVKNAMRKAISGGTAAHAAPESGDAGAKTATAETGWYQDGEAVVQAWCAGFTEKYSIVVFAENGRSGSAACAPIFKQLADGLAELAGA
ncbi:MAG: penicillin-binding protein 2 [Clostridia bacterium]|nr:penicillin-binding protein 2 [Clostridia bacterium]